MFLFKLFTGKFDFYVIAQASPFWGPVILLLFTLFVALVLVNFFITIIIDSYEQVREDLSKQPNEHEIVDFIVDRFKTYTGMKSAAGDKKKKNKGRLSDDTRKAKLEFEADQYVEGEQQKWRS